MSRYIYVAIAAAVFGVIYYQHWQLGRAQEQIEVLQTQSLIDAAKSKAKQFEIRHRFVIPKIEEVHHEINTTLGTHTLSL